MGRTVKHGFTLVELLIVMLIIAVLALLAWGALAGVAEQAKETRTRSIVMKLDSLVMQRWDSYKTRPLPVPRPAGFSPQLAATMRLAAIRDLMRMELPDRKTDVLDPPADIDPRPGLQTYMAAAALQRTYQRKALVATGGNLANWTETSQGAECLYLIISTMHDGDKNALDFFQPGEIGDYDGDGMREILDGWGRPIEFLRWAPGFRIENGMLTMQRLTAIPGTNQQPADQFDPLKLEPNSFALHPLIYSAGPDKSFDILTDNIPAPFHRYCPPMTDNNWPRPYMSLTLGAIGEPYDDDGNGWEYADNITNHYRPPTN